MQNSFNVFKNFRCKKGKCTRSCCQGWQIDIDSKTLKKYSALCIDSNADNSIKERLKKCVDYKKRKFKMKKGSCPFLNENGLCDLIIAYGKNYLSNTCKRHPRFISEFSDRIECGYGLACEKATEMLVNCPEPLRIYKTERKKGTLSDFEKYILTERDNLIDFIYNSDVNGIIDRIQTLTDFPFDDKSITAFLTELTQLETTRSGWKETVIKALSQAPIEFYGLIGDKEYDLFKNLLAYFIYRHTPNSADKLDFLSRVIFSLLSAVSIFTINRSTNEDIKITIRDYSIEVEYSNDNIFSLLDYIEEQKFVSNYKK